MKNRIRPKRSCDIRPLKPKSMLPMKNLAIQSLSFVQDNEGITLMIIKPNHITLNSRELISMIDEKRDRIDAGNNAYILSKDILTAIHNHQTKNDKTQACRNDDQRDLDAIKFNEPKRPSNAFIFYNNALRKKIRELFPNYSNSDISKIIGGMWKSVGSSEKDKYIKKAIECRKLHKERYPKFEYNIRRDTGINCTKIFDSKKKANNWENYFDWCLQNSTTESSAGVLQYSHESLIDPSNLTCAVSNDFFSQELQISGEWNEVCQLVSHFFPGDTDQNELVDEQFWKSLDDVDFLADLSVNSSGIHNISKTNDTK
ncbi:hypothetical protein [Parasitella parasitica]|uniref:HMG box domain-containing protein n=1 Tax=Parasitella parasitica TaxID=35722 RepID=A0A0B7NH98_9FUNG|nr:hypothetical protein [Parasitella parasitica]